MHAQRNVSNSNGAIPIINTTRILEKKANWCPKNDHTHSLISLCLYTPWNAMVGRTKRSKEPLPPSRSQKGGGTGYPRLHSCILHWQRGLLSQNFADSPKVQFQTDLHVVSGSFHQINSLISSTLFRYSTPFAEFPLLIKDVNILLLLSSVPYFQV